MPVKEKKVARDFQDVPDYVREASERREQLRRVDGHLPRTPSSATNQEYYILLTNEQGKKLDSFMLFTFCADVVCYTVKKWARHTGLNFYRLRVYTDRPSMLAEETPVLDSLGIVP